MKIAVEGKITEIITSIKVELFLTFKFNCSHLLVFEKYLLNDIYVIHIIFD